MITRAKVFTIIGIVSIFSLLLYIVNMNGHLNPAVRPGEEYIMNIFIIIVGALVIWVTVHNSTDN